VEGGAAAPAEAGDAEVAVAGGEFGDVGGDGVEVGVDLVGGRVETARVTASWPG